MLRPDTLEYSERFVTAVAGLTLCAVGRNIAEFRLFNGEKCFDRIMFRIYCTCAFFCVDGERTKIVYVDIGLKTLGAVHYISSKPDDLLITYFVFGNGRPIRVCNAIVSTLLLHEFCTI